jgi:polar amino acid transport system substrate-binding protein
MTRFSGWRAGIGIVIIALLATACGDGDGGSGGSSRLQTVQSGTLTVCSDIPYAPFEFEEDGKQVGIDVDLVTAIAAELDLKVSIKDTDFDGIFAALAAGQCDMVASSVSITDERKANNEFTQGYYEIQQSLLVRKADANRYKSLADLAGRAIGVQSGTTGETYAKSRLPAGATVRSFTGADELFTALKAGQIDGIVQDLPVNAYNAEKSGDTAVSARLPSETEQYGLVIRKGNTALRDAADRALTELKNNGRHAEILKKYLGSSGA